MPASFPRHEAPLPRQTRVARAQLRHDEKKACRRLSGTPCFCGFPPYTTIALLGPAQALAPAEPLAQARTQYTCPGVNPPRVTREAVERS